MTTDDEARLTGRDPASDSLPIAEFGYSGPLRDQLVAAILDGSKTTTTGLWLDYEADGSPLPKPGELHSVIDSAGKPVAVIEILAASIVRIADVDLQHCIDEGEGDTTVAGWREGHTRFFESAEMREVLGAPDFKVEDDTLVVVQRFRLV